MLSNGPCKRLTHLYKQNMATVLESLNAALRQALLEDERVYLLGEDILDPYGGAFKVTRGLSQDFPNRVITTPISEAGIVGIATGMALRGLRPVVEIMFGDFLTLAADQLINHAAKFRWMYNDRVRAPLVVRTPMGGRRGYGPTHSQTLEKHFLGVPGLRVLAPTTSGDPGALLLNAIQDDDPVLFIENKLLYTCNRIDENLDDYSIDPYVGSVHVSTSENQPSLCPIAYRLNIKDAPPPQLSLAAYGYMAELARQAVHRLAYEFEIFAELTAYTQLSPLDITPLQVSTRHTGKLLVVEEGCLAAGWGAEVVARLSENPTTRQMSYRRLAARDLPVPASGPLEAAILPSIEEIVQTARMMV